MITEMVIAIPNADIECNSVIQFLQIILHVGTVLKYEIDNIQIAMAGIGIVTIIQAQKSHSGSKVYALTVFLPVKSSGKQCMVFVVCEDYFCLCCVYAGLLCQ